MHSLTSLLLNNNNKSTFLLFISMTKLIDLFITILLILALLDSNESNKFSYK